MENILITGGAGFVGANLSVYLKKTYPKTNIIVMDNLKRRGSELNITRLKNNGIQFVHGDVRNLEDFELGVKVDLIIECSAEPSVIAGLDTSPQYLINTNLLGAINCLEYARKYKSKFIFLSTSRVYPYEYINNLKIKETKTRFELESKQTIKGASKQGISEEFPLDKARSLYGSTKLASELFIKEYADSFGLEFVINRFGCIAGPWQMGKVDQGVMALWVSKHYFKKSLKYIGFGGKGKQVRDFIHIDDLCELLKIQINKWNIVKNKTFNVGGGLENSCSLLELTKICEKVTGNSITIQKEMEDRPMDEKVYITDSSLIRKTLNWKPKKDLESIVKDTYDWIKENESQLRVIFN